MEGSTPHHLCPGTFLNLPCPKTTSQEASGKLRTLFCAWLSKSLYSGIITSPSPRTTDTHALGDRVLSSVLAKYFLVFGVFGLLFWFWGPHQVMLRAYF